MLETCTECGQDFITEADCYGIQRRPDRTVMACGKCFVGLIEPHRLEAIKQKDAEIEQAKELIKEMRSTRLLTKEELEKIKALLGE